MFTDKNAVRTRCLRNRTITTYLNPDPEILKRKECVTRTGILSTAKSGNLKLDKPGNLKTDKPGNLRTDKSGNMKTDKPGNLRTDTSGNRKTDKPGNLKTLKSGTLNNKTSNAERKALHGLNQKVGSNALILDCIFGFLSFEDIKRFRLVCRQWNEVAIHFVKNLCVISFNRPLYSLEIFNQHFRNSQLGTEFTAVKLTYAKEGRGANEGWPMKRRRDGWKLKEVTQLLKDQGIRMDELTIESIWIQDVHYSDFFDLSPYVGPSLTKLNIQDMREMRISTDRCISIKFLSLGNCVLSISNGIKINPIELTLKNVVIKSNGNEQASSLNEFVNFDRLECLSLDDCTIEYVDDLSLHFRDPLTVKNVDLCGRYLDLDFENAKWKVTEKLSLRKTDFLIQNEMEFFNLEFEDARLDLAVLPRNLKTLQISEIRVTRVLCTNPIRFPELEFLHLSKTAIPREFRGFIPTALELDKISLFNNCENLKTVMFTLHKLPMLDLSSEDCSVDFDINLLPKKVQKLCIYGEIRFFGKASSFLLKQLNVRESDQDSLNSILSRFRGEVLAVDLRCQWYSDSSAIVSLFQTVMDIAERPFDRIAVAFNHNKQKSKFKASQLSKCTDEMSEYYLFTNKFGKAISESQFEEFFAFAENMRKKYGIIID